MMTTKQKLVWRLKEQPTSENLRELVKDGILSKDEAREVLFSSETEEDRDKESLKSEIKFLRGLIEKLATTQKVVEIIRDYTPYWRKYPWYEPYEIWCGNSLSITDCDSSSSNNLAIYTSSNFSDIKTF